MSSTKILMVQVFIFENYGYRGILYAISGRYNSRLVIYDHIRMATGRYVGYSMKNIGTCAKC